tara:strand:+ start:1015 stop:1125 length:111 start_codon:yes stop_codon:yes gene_type:complete
MPERLLEPFAVPDSAGVQHFTSHGSIKALFQQNVFD